MTTHLEQLHEKLKLSCPELEGKSSSVARVSITTTGQTFRVAQVDLTKFYFVQQILDLNLEDWHYELYQKGILSFLETKKISRETLSFLVYLWCWRDWHKDKRFKWPIVLDDVLSTKHSFLSNGGHHRLHVAHSYNMIFNKDYTLETISEKFIDGPLYNKPVSKFIEGPNRYVNTNKPYSVVYGHQCNISRQGGGQEVEILESIINSIEWPDRLLFDNSTAKHLNTLCNTNFFESGSNCIDLTVHAPLLKLSDQYSSVGKEHVSDHIISGLFSCIFLKIPVESRYFSLKFQK